MRGPLEASPESLERDWKAGRFAPAYYLAGDPSRVREALGKLRSAVNPGDFDYSRWSGDLANQAGAILSDAQTPPMMGALRLVLVEGPRLPAGLRDDLAQYLTRPLETTVLAIAVEERKADPRDPVVVAASACGKVATFPAYREEDAVRLVLERARRAGKPLDPEAATLLVGEIGTDSTILRQELEKMILFAGVRPRLVREDVMACLGYERDADPFALGRHVQKRALRESLQALRRLFKSGRPDDQAYRALNQVSQAVFRQFQGRKLLGAGVPEEDIFKTLRLNRYWDRTFTSELGRIAPARLRTDLEDCLRTEARLKSESWLDPALEVQQLIVRLCAASS